MRLIDADALKQDMCDRVLSVYDVDIIIDDAPTIEQTAPEGRWMKGKEFPSYPRVPFSGYDEYCSVCENIAYWDSSLGRQLFNFCPNCGARMKEETK